MGSLSVIFDFTVLISIWHCHESIDTSSTNDGLCRDLFVKCKDEDKAYIFETDATTNLNVAEDSFRLI
jgi:hypothetical protein